MEFTFTLKYELQASDTDALVERLAEEGCNDALVGVGQSGRLSLEFAREAGSVKEAVESALEDVRRAVPDAKLIAATPGLVGLLDVPEIMVVSRPHLR
ncbi:hypothetical protein SAMN05216593_101613 [Pseudomonas asturiensis]|uniref:DNA-binding protein n=1 Tax=Pseudomonas asturiensis TaxID=1190415 RepID=A0A1M7JXJ6_9PSED|nr:hypothetical protein SAMN05216593_101613 [Pseudomonas asturiensis]